MAERLVGVVFWLLEAVLWAMGIANMIVYGSDPRYMFVGVFALVSGICIAVLWCKERKGIVK